MALLSLQNITLGFGGHPLLDDVTVRLGEGERIALLGRNGAGKSTLLKLINGEIEADAGEIVAAPTLRTARLIQEVPPEKHGAIFDVVAAGTELESAEIDVRWKFEQQIEAAISMVELDPQTPFESLSSGMKRRALLARTLASQPDVLLLDEPTNHLDLESITWLEEFLKRFAGTLLFVTHDRVFMERLATRIIELEQGRLFDWTCDYPTFLQRKEAILHAEAQQQAQFDKKLAQEETWIRQGIKARRTRNEGRVRALQELRRQHRDRRQKVGNVRMQASEAARSGRLVIAADSISFHREERPIVRDLSITLMRGDKVGVLGPNGCGKTTLLRLLLGDLPPDSGEVRRGENLEVAYFDQLRAQIDDEQTVGDNVSGGADTVLVEGQRRHVIGYLQDFLFTAERVRSPAKYLSGGERNRLLLAKLFTKPSNVLVLDEPTNDLDTETLELLESLLVEYRGTVLLVSHDRAFLNNVVTSVLAFEGDGEFKEYEGGYDDWLRAQRRARPDDSAAPEPQPAPKQPPETKKPARNDRRRKLSFHEKRELEQLPEQIEALEREQAELHAAMGDPDFFRNESARIAEATARLAELEAKLQAAYERWEALETLER